MSKGYRDGAFALGIVVGGGFVLNLFLWLSYAARHKIESHDPSGQNAQDDQEAALWWWRWTGDLVSSSDTLAQWIMAFFTIGATIVLVFTLRSANKTNLAAIKASEAALEANQIMREMGYKQLRAYVQFERAEVLGENWSQGHPCQMHIAFKNTGQTPAINVQVSYYYLETRWDQIERMLQREPIWDPKIMSKGWTKFYCGIIGASDNFYIEQEFKDGFPSDWLKVIQDPDLTYLVSGIITYQDVTMPCEGRQVDRRTRFSCSIPNPKENECGRTGMVRNELEK